MTIITGPLMKRLITLTVSAAVALMLVPLPAHADSYKTASVRKTVSTQAGKRVGMYVVTKVVGLDPSYTSTEYAYGKNGLLLKRTRHSRSKSKADDVMDYQYMKSRLVSSTRKKVSSQYSDDEKVTYTYDKKGNLTQCVRFVVSIELTGEDAGDVSTNKTIHKATYDKKGRIKMYKSKLVVDDEDVPYQVYYYKSYNKQGRRTKEKLADSDFERIYYYDKHGNLTHTSTNFPTFKFKLKYDKKGNLVKRYTYDPGFKEVVDAAKYTYKRVSVPKSYVKVVRAQQYAIVNPGVDPMLSLD